jgi:predicted DNA binding CopG/RHH family protein
VAQCDRNPHAEYHADYRRKLSTRKKRLPRLSSNKAAEDFIATADLTRYDLSGMVPVRFEFKPKTERVNMRLSKDLLDSVKKRADKTGVSYQRFIRLALERAVAEG